MEVTFVEELVDLGPLGPTRVYQVPGSQFQQACLQRNSADTDNTGYRLHAGAYVAIRFLEKLSFLLFNRSLIELGTGSGVVGSAASRLAPLSRAALTDGNDRALDIANLNSVVVSVSVCTFMRGAFKSASFARSTQTSILKFSD